MVWHYCGIVTLAFHSNNESNRGAAIIVDQSIKVRVEDSDFKNNYSKKEGGAIYSEGHLTVSHSRFNDNESAINGGAVYAAEGSVLELQENTFIGNIADEGPDVYNGG